MIKYIITLFIISVCLSIPRNLIAEHIISYSVFGNGGISQTGDAHYISGTIGQPASGASTCMSYRNCLGYWYINNCIVVPTLVEHKALPEYFRLLGNYPNPFNPATSIQFEIPVKCHVCINVYSITGQRVSTLLDNPVSEGRHTVKWKPVDLSAGLYLYSLEAGNKRLIGKMLYLK